MQNDESVLLAQLAAGSERAFADLVDQFQGRVRRVCLGFFPNRHDAEDLVQEVFIDVYRALPGFRGEAQLGTLIYRIAVRRCLGECRFRQRARRSSFFKALVGLETMPSEPVEMDHPGVLLEHRERSKVLFEHLEKLPDNQRTAFVLQKIEGLSQREIAAVLNLREGAVESLLSRAKHNLRARLTHFYTKNEL